MMTAAQAIAVLAQPRNERDDNEAIEALSTLYHEVAARVRSTDGLLAWLEAGDYDGTETIARIVAEWERLDAMAHESDDA